VRPLQERTPRPSRELGGRRPKLARRGSLCLLPVKIEMGRGRGGGCGREAYGFVGIDVEGENLLVGGHYGELHLGAAGWNRTPPPRLWKERAFPVGCGLRGRRGEGESTGVKSGIRAAFLLAEVVRNCDGR
jgi:hypothetical protein